MGNDASNSNKIYIFFNYLINRIKNVRELSSLTFLIEYRKKTNEKNSKKKDRYFRF